MSKKRKDEQLTFPQITALRLRKWAKFLKEKNATPIVMVSVGHGWNSGEVIVQTTENRTDKEMYIFLKQALNEIERRMAKSN